MIYVTVNLMKMETVFFLYLMTCCYDCLSPVTGKALSAEACDEDLADFLATLNDIAKKGSLSVDDGAGPVAGGSSGRTASAPTTPIKDRRSRLRRSEAVAEDLGGRLDLTADQATALDAMVKKKVRKHFILAVVTFMTPRLFFRYIRQGYLYFQADTGEIALMS